jgi:hypothetical protein
MKKILNIKFAILTIIIALLFFLFRAIALNLSLDYKYLHLISTLFIILFVYYLTISFSEREHKWRTALILVIGVLIFNIISALVEYNDLFIIRILGLLFSMLFISITYVDRIKKWFFS